MNPEFEKKHLPQRSPLHIKICKIESQSLLNLKPNIVDVFEHFEPLAVKIASYIPQDGHG